MFFRTLPPAQLPHLPFSGYFAASQQKLSAKVASFADSNNVLLTSSGSAALFLVLKNLAERSGRGTVAIPAYTCPDVASACIAAGLKIILIDVDDSLELVSESISDSQLADSAAVVLCNLYGIPNSLEPWRERCASADCTLVDDVCQAAGSNLGGEMLGNRKGVVSILSFGRGKSFSGLGGGAVIGDVGFEGKLNSSSGNLRDLARVMAMRLFGIPSLYGIPKTLLNLGETSYHEFRYNENLSKVAIASGINALKGKEEFWKQSQQKAIAWSEVLEIEQPLLLRNLSLEDCKMIRYPVLLDQDVELSCFGVTSSYAKVIADFEEVSSFLIGGECSKARKVASRLYTLPVHGFVTEQDIKKVGRVLNEASSSP